MFKYTLACLAALLCAAITSSNAAAMSRVIVISDQAALRAAPRNAAQQQATLRQGEMLELRGEKLDYFQVYDHQRERGGYVLASQVHRTELSPEQAPELLAVLRFVKDTPGQEALGIGLAAAWLKASPAAAVQGAAGMEALDALGTLADRLASRASAGALGQRAAEATLAAHLEVAGRYGLRFASYEHEGKMQVCYDGEAFRRVLAMAASAEQKARAALGLTRPECVDPNLRVHDRRALNEWRAQVLDRVEASALPGYLKNRVLLGRAGLWSELAYQRARAQEPDPALNAAQAAQAAQRALAELGGINKAELTDEDQARYNLAAIRVNASRWAAAPLLATPQGKAPIITTVAGQPGETCVLLVDARQGADQPLARRCTYGLVWPQSATLNREGNALALAVQPMAAWRELWLFRKEAGNWTISILPPAAITPETGYAEFAGWVPGGKQMLVAREARGDGKYQRNFAVLNLDTLVPERQASDPSLLGAFQRWPDAGWKHNSVSVR